MRKTVLEQVEKSPNSSFRILVNPKLHDFYYWHFHPEFELTYIEGVDGTRHIGNHKANYYDGDLAFIGSYIPHLNFDYGVKGLYSKIVLQIDKDFLSISNLSSSTPELKKIHKLIEDSKFGIVFNNDLKKEIGPLMKKISEKSGFQLFLEVLHILEQLSKPKSYILLHKQPYQNNYYEKQQEKVRKVITFIESNYQNKITVADLAQLTNYSEAAFCRYFKKMTKLSFTTFLNNYRIDIAKQLLMEGNNVTESAFSSGYESVSYFNRVFKKMVGLNPKDFKNSTVSN